MVIRKENAENYLTGLREKIYSGFSPLLAFEQDPFLLFESRLDAWTSDISDLEVKDGFLSTYDDTQAYIFLQAECLNSPFDKGRSQGAIDEYRKIEQDLSQRYPDVVLKKTGVLFFANAQANQIESEIKLISTVSIAFITLLLFFFFKSFKPILLTLCTLGFGIFHAGLVLLTLKGECHIVTLGFGATLIGIAVDYAFHYLFGASKDPVQEKKLLSNIAMGCLTSVLSFSVFLFTPFKVFQEISLFITAGLISSFLFVIVVFPKASFKTPRPCSPIHSIFSCSCLRFSNKKLYTGLAIIFIGIASLTITTITFSHDIRSLGAAEEQILANDQWIKKLKGELDTSRMVVIEADSPDQLIRHEELFLESLQETAYADHQFLSLSRYFVSIEKQKEHLQLWKAYLQQHSNDIQTYLAEFNFPDTTFQQLIQEIDQTPILSTEQFQTLGMFKNLQNELTVHLPNKEIAFLFYHGQEVMKEALPPLSFVTPLNRIQHYSSLLNTFRENFLYYFAFFFVFILIAMILLFGLYKGILVCVSSTFAITTTLLLASAFSSDGLNLFHLLALLLIWGIGMDYSIMMMRSKEKLDHVITANFCSTLTTLCSFGILSISQAPVLHTFGLTILIGITISFIVSSLLFTKVHSN